MPSFPHANYPFFMATNRSLFLLLTTMVCLLINSTAYAGETWLTDFATAKAAAARDHKKLLLDFTGSDWCAVCIRLEKEVFASPDFATFSKDCLLVRLDYPVKKPQSGNLKTQNAVLKDEFKIEAYPTVIVLDETGAEL